MINGKPWRVFHFPCKSQLKWFWCQLERHFNAILDRQNHFNSCLPAQSIPQYNPPCSKIQLNDYWLQPVTCLGLKWSLHHCSNKFSSDIYILCPLDKLNCPYWVNYYSCQTPGFAEFGSFLCMSCSCKTNFLIQVISEWYYSISAWYSHDCPPPPPPISLCISQHGVDHIFYYHRHFKMDFPEIKCRNFD